MDNSSDQPSEAHPDEEVTARVSADGVSVRKTASPYGGDAVAVYLTIRSDREVDCAVRIADAIPEALRGQEVEFHPRYDPGNWRLADGTAVYTATIAPDTERTSAYGITVDDPGQVRLFAAEPALEVSGGPALGSADAPSPGDDSFDFGPGEDSPDEAQPTPPSTSPEVAVSRTIDEPGHASEPSRSGATAVGQEAESDDPVEALVATIRRRDLTDAEQRALKQAVDAGGEVEAEALESLRTELGTLEDDLATVERRTAEIEPLERRVESLADELESLRDALDREVRWRSQLQESIEADPEPE